MMFTLLRFPSWAVFVAAFVFSGTAFAQSVAAPSSFEQFMEKVTGAGKQTVGFSANGTPTIAPGVPTITPDGGLPRVNTSGGIRNPSGNTVPVTATGRIPGSVAAKAVGKFAAKVLPGVAWAIAIKELADELGFKLDKDSAGLPTYQKNDPSVCTVAPCYEYAYRTSANGSTSATGFYSTANAACQASLATSQAANPGITFTFVSASAGSCNYRTSSGGSQVFTYNGTTRSVSPSPAVFLPSTQQEFLDAIAVKSGWPSSSAIGRAIVATGERVDPGPLVVTGPSTSPGPSSTTLKPDGKTVTTNTTHNHTYNGDTITTVTTVITNTYNPATNTTETETTTKTPEAEPDPDNTTVDTPLPDLPKLYEPKYPQGLTGVWAQKKAELVATPLASLVSQLMPSVGTGGTCPAWSLNLSLGAWDYGTHNVAPPCYIWDWCKFFIIAGALLLARALIFGG